MGKFVILIKACLQDFKNCVTWITPYQTEDQD